LDSHMPIYYRTFPGNIPDSRSVETILTDLNHAGFPKVILVTDRGSTNGTSLVTADGTVTGIAPGVPTEVPAGCSVRFGARTVRLLSTGPAGGSL
ncbi:MAG TPA: hypothetical protein P5193_15815, partial [Microthrixaceae bacterium]|nr:hypothetical protein [Microthrixaceae bacterium]